MEHWTDQGIILSARTHGEGGAVVKLLTEHMGQHAGYVHGAHSAAKRPVLECGNLVSADWQARTHDQLGTYKLEAQQQFAVMIMEDRKKLAALHALCALLDQSLPERENHCDLFHATTALLTVMAHSGDDIALWGAAYIKWEIGLLRDLGFSLDFTRCAGGGNAQELAYISPKSGCAVSYQAGEPYKDKLLPLPAFLKPNGGPCDELEIAKGLKVTTTFLEKWVFAQHTQGVPEVRKRLDSVFYDIAQADITG